MAYDLVIENGRIVDGSGRAEFPGGVAVNDGKIVEVGEVSGAAKRRIDAKGLVIAPGIVDIHTHYDAQVLWDPLLTSSVWHGVTTVVMGNCGFTIAPCKPDDQDYIMRMLARVEGMSLGAMRQGPEWDWRTFEEYMERVGQTLGLNAACQVGHSALRYTVMGSDALEREATPDEVEAMCGLLRDALAVGAVGFTTSISRAHVDWEGNPVPSRFAAVSEIDALVAMVGERLSEEDALCGYLLDGFPRNTAQAAALDVEIGEGSMELALSLEVEEAELVSRILGRAAELGRSDDNEETIRRRLEVYLEETEPLLSYYPVHGVAVIAVDGFGSVDEVFSRVVLALAERS